MAKIDWTPVRNAKTEVTRCINNIASAWIDLKNQNDPNNEQTILDYETAESIRLITCAETLAAEFKKINPSYGRTGNLYRLIHHTHADRIREWELQVCNPGLSNRWVVSHTGDSRSEIVDWCRAHQVPGYAELTCTLAGELGSNPER